MQALKAFHDEVRSRHFPSAPTKNSKHRDEIDKFLEVLDKNLGLVERCRVCD